MRYYKRVNSDGITTTVEGYSHDMPVVGAKKITKQEHDDFIDNLPVVEPEPPIDLRAEVAALKVRIVTLENKNVVAE